MRSEFARRYGYRDLYMRTLIEPLYTANSVGYKTESDIIKHT